MTKTMFFKLAIFPYIHWIGFHYVQERSDMIGAILFYFALIALPFLLNFSSLDIKNKICERSSFYALNIKIVLTDISSFLDPRYTGGRVQ